MNTRCYRCGWSFSLSREAMEEAAVSDAGQKAHVIYCPRCRQAINIPMDQIVRALPPGWTPAAAGEVAPAETDAAAGATSAAATRPARRQPQKGLRPPNGHNGGIGIEQVPHRQLRRHLGGEEQHPP